MIKRQIKELENRRRRIERLKRISVKGGDNWRSNHTMAMADGAIDAIDDALEILRKLDEGAILMDEALSEFVEYYQENEADVESLLVLPWSDDRALLSLYLMSLSSVFRGIKDDYELAHNQLKGIARNPPKSERK